MEDLKAYEIAESNFAEHLFNIIIYENILFNIHFFNLFYCYCTA